MFFGFEQLSQTFSSSDPMSVPCRFQLSDSTILRSVEAPGAPCVHVSRDVRGRNGLWRRFWGRCQCTSFSCRSIYQVSRRPQDGKPAGAFGGPQKPRIPLPTKTAFVSAGPCFLLIFVLIRGIVIRHWAGVSCRFGLQLQLPKVDE